MTQTIQAIVGNRVTRFIATPEQLTELKKHFSYEVPGARFSWKYQHGLWDGRKNFLRQSRVPTGLFLDQYKRIADTKFDCKWEVLCPHFTPFAVPPEEDKYYFQHQCVAAMVNHSMFGGIILNATGTGKTRIAAMYFDHLIERGCFVVDELTLMEQAHREIASIVGAKEVGRIGGGILKPKRITVATSQTLQSRSGDPTLKDWFHSQDVVILDEAHLALNDRSHDIIRAMNPKAVFGLTATLQLDKPDVRMRAVALCGPPIFTYPLSEGVKSGVLSKSIAILVEFK